MLKKLVVIPTIIFILLLVTIWRIITKIIGLLTSKSSSTKSKKAHLYVIPYSHFCEKARLSLDLCKVDYIEHQTPPVIHMFSTLYHSNGTGTSTPLLITEEKKILQDSGDILKDLYDKGNTWLYPNYKETRALEEYIEKEIGIHIRRVAYFHLFKTPELIQELVLRSATGISYPILKFFFTPIFTPMMQKSMNIYEKPSEKSFERVCVALEKLSDMISDGRKNLLETEKYSAADITLASLMYPITCPSSMEDICFTEEQVFQSNGLKTLIEKLKKYPAFEYALKVHQDLRGNEKIQIKFK